MRCEFELEVDTAPDGGDFVVRVVQAVSSDRPTSSFRLDGPGLADARDAITTAVLDSMDGRPARNTSGERLVRDLGTRLFDALFHGPVGDAYEASLLNSRALGELLFVTLRLKAPQLAAIPWEAMFDTETGEFLCLTGPLIRRVDADLAPDPREVDPPVHVLGVAALPGAIDVDAEREKISTSLTSSSIGAQVVVSWLEEQASWDTIQQKLLSGRWHVVHFIGHGTYDELSDQGELILSEPEGSQPYHLDGENAASLLRQAVPPPKLVILNSCMTGKSGANDQFSSVAAKLVKRGIEAVAAMQFTISDASAIAFTRGFYSALAGGHDIDVAMHAGRVAIAVGTRSLEWITPVLYAHGSTNLFNLTGSTNEDAPGGRDTEARRSKRLIVFVPGLGKEPSAIDELYERLRSDPAFGPADDTYLFAYPDGMSLFSRGTMAQRCAEIAFRIDSFASTIGDVDDVILIGHSVGGLMVRESYLQALPGPDNPGFDWAQRVTRIVLLASLNAGFDLKRVKPCRRLLAYALTAVPLGFASPDALASSAFMGSLRTRWMEHMAALGDRAPIVVQLLGNDDQKVAYRDSLDVDGLPRGAQRALPNATHEDIVRISDVPEDFPGQRYEVLRWAILGEPDSVHS
jgi:hypothetical protein